MSRLTESVIRRFERIDNTRLGSDAVAGLLGVVFFSFTVGLEKLKPRYVGWLIHGDQQTMLLGWWFYASDRWRWPLGANPMLGWEGTNSIVYTDSWPGLALIFKILNIGAVIHGQYFGLGLLLGSVALFVGARRLFGSLEVGFLPSLAATGLLGTTSVFWYMQRWGPAISAGLPIVVWALYFYIDDPKHPASLWRRWSLLLVAAVATNAYLTFAATPILGALLVRRFVHDRRSWFGSLVGLMTVGAITVGSMYALGYSTLSSKWAQTGGYGWYSANVLGLFDSKGASRLLPDLPSIAGQHEPTALGIGTLLLAAALLANRLRSRVPFGIRKSLKEHAPLAVVLIGLAILAVTNIVSIGSWSFRVPLPARIEHGLSIFRSSARLLWPMVIVVTVSVTTIALRRIRRGAIIVSLALAVQLVDSTPQIQSVASARDGDAVQIPFDSEFWTSVPARFATIASVPAANYGFDWSSCALAAARTNRAAECGYFGRVQGLDSVNRERITQVVRGAFEGDVIYMVSRSWLRDNGRDLLNTLSRGPVNVAVAKDVFGFGTDTYLLFPNCPSPEACDFLGDHYHAFDSSLLESNL